MLLLQAKGIVKFYGEEKILDIPQFTVYTGDKIGVLGRNGAGKTTFLDVLSGDIEPDRGEVRCYCKPAYARQFAERDENNRGRDARSKGEEAKVKLARVFGSGSPLLLLDEPTSDLDREGIKTLYEQMNSAESFLLVSHDRELLKTYCNRIVEVEGGTVHFFDGGYSFYRQEKDRLTARRYSDYESYDKERKKLMESAAEAQKRSKGMQDAPTRMGNSEARLHKGSAQERRKKVQRTAATLRNRLENLNVAEKPRELPPVCIDFSLTDPPEGKRVIRCNDLTYEKGGKILFDRASFTVENGSKTALIGNNGAGKTTLLHLISEGYEGITIAPKAVIGYMKQSGENVDLDKTVLQNAAEDSVQTQTAIRTVLARLGFSADDLTKKAAVLSGGERIKLSFARLILSRCNILFLDEPTNYLDIPSMEALKDVLSGYRGTVVFVSHDSVFIRKTASHILKIENGSIIEIRTEDDF